VVARAEHPVDERHQPLWLATIVPTSARPPHAGPALRSTDRRPAGRARQSPRPHDHRDLTARRSPGPAGRCVYRRLPGRSAPSTRLLGANVRRRSTSILWRIVFITASARRHRRPATVLANDTSHGIASCSGIVHRFTTLGFNRRIWLRICFLRAQEDCATKESGCTRGVGV
jgi:hypothetical protein